MKAIEELRAALDIEALEQRMGFVRDAGYLSDEEAAFVANEYIKRAIRKCAAVCKDRAERSLTIGEAVAANSCAELILSALSPKRGDE